MKKRSIGKLCVILSAVLLVAAGVILWGLQKEEFKELAYGYGPLNTMELDDLAVSNDHESTFFVEKGEEFQIRGNLIIMQGTVSVTIRMGNQVLMQAVYEEGEHKYETDILNSKAVRVSGASEGKIDDDSETVYQYLGTVIVELEVSDDAQGQYGLGYYRRRNNFQKFLNQITEQTKSRKEKE